jgi:protein-histidine N-methyltransferase
MSAFSFSFSGDDIEDDSSTQIDTEVKEERKNVAESGTLHRTSPSTSSAFPISGQPLLPPKSHSLDSLLATLPSKIAYSTLKINLDDGSEIKIPRRELWDVRVQLMAEDEGGEGMVGLGKDDVKTGVYEGGFKSWESSVDVVRVLSSRQQFRERGFGGRVLELGCGTALPMMAIWQWVLEGKEKVGGGLSLGLADYNPSVLQLVTLPNLLLSWGQYAMKGNWEEEGEMDIDEEVQSRFLAEMRRRDVNLSFFSGAWSPDFVKVVGESMASASGPVTIIGAETIYSPFALKSFAETLMCLLESMNGKEKTSLVAAKKVYFGVGGSMEDFCEMVRGKGASVEQIREESDGVRRAVVEIKMRASRGICTQQMHP